MNLDREASNNFIFCLKIFNLKGMIFVIWQFTMRERIIKRCQISILSCILAIFASLAFTSVIAFADVRDANVSINWGSPDPYSLIPNSSLSEDSDQETSTDGSRVAMFRLYNKWTGEHFYTSSKSERDNIAKVGWVYEQIEWYAPTSEDFKPVYRLYNKYVSGGDHHYTTSADEKDECVKAGWTYEGEGWRTVEAGATDYVKVLRQYNPYATTGTHNYTTDENEQKYLASLGWKAEADGGWGGYSKLEPSTPTPATTFTVTFNSNGGTAVAKQTVQSGKTATKPANPTKSGYTFDGWYSDSALTKSFNFSTPITVDTTLYAKWKENSSGAPQAFAVYSKDDSSLNFYKRSTVPTEGSKFNGKTATYVYSGIENLEGSAPWCKWGHATTGRELGGLVTNVTVVDDGIQPKNMKSWFDLRGGEKSLTAISNLDKIDTSKTTNMVGCFYGVQAQTIDGISKWDTSSVTTMTQMFGKCSALKNLNLSNWNTANVESLNYMFFECSELVSVGDLSKWDVSKCEYMYRMFKKCNALESLENISKWNTSKVSTMNEMFCLCSSLKSLDLSGWNVSNVTDMKNLFCGCSSLTSLKVANWNTSNVTSMSYMFNDCSSLKSLNVTNFDTGKVTNMSGMFSGCSSLPSLKVANWNTSNVTSMSYMFNDCSSLKSLNVTNFDTGKVTDMSCMFSGCSSLESLDVTKLKTSNVEWMDTMFSHCSSLKSLNVSNLDTSKVTSMMGMFWGCSSLESLDVTKFNTTAVREMGYMFMDCSSLTFLDVSNFDTSNVREQSEWLTGMDGVFKNCSSLTVDCSMWAIDPFLTPSHEDFNTNASGVIEPNWPN